MYLAPRHPAMTGTATRQEWRERRLIFCRSSSACPLPAAPKEAGISSSGSPAGMIATVIIYVHIAVDRDDQIGDELQKSLRQKLLRLRGVIALDRNTPDPGAVHPSVLWVFQSSTAFSVSPSPRYVSAILP